MDALGALTSLGTLKQFIPSLSFVGVYNDYQDIKESGVAGQTHSIDTNSWKLGFATIAFTKEWSFESTSYYTLHSYVISILCAPGFIAYPGRSNAGRYGGEVRFYTDRIDVLGSAQYVSILFNY